MVLSDGEIWEAIKGGDLVFDPPLEPEQVSTSSIDLRLGYQFTTFPPEPRGYTTSVNLGSEVDVEAGAQRYGETILLNEDDMFELTPGLFVLAFTLEHITLSYGLAARVEGRSSWGRLGISIHQTAPTIQAGFTGNLRLEILNNGPHHCKLPPKVRACQLIVERLGRPANSSLQSRFQGQRPKQ